MANFDVINTAEELSEVPSQIGSQQDVLNFYRFY